MKEFFFYDDRPLEPDLISEIFLKTHGKTLGYKYWEWRILNNPDSAKVYINYLLSDGVIASILAASPLKILIDGRTHNGALLNMLMTHPDHQGKGYFTLLANDLINRLKEDGFIGLMGFANQNSHYGFRKNSGWVDLSQLNGFSVNNNDFKGNWLKFNENIICTDSPIDPDHIQKAAELTCSHQKIIPGRSENFLDWRLLKNPVNQYRTLLIHDADVLTGIIFYKFYNGSIDILEYFFNKNNDSDSNENLIRGFSFLIKKYDCSINIWSNLHTEEHLILEKYGFRENNFLTYFGVIPFRFEEPLTNIRNWHYRFIDSDVF